MWKAGTIASSESVRQAAHGAKNSRFMMTYRGTTFSNDGCTQILVRHVCFRSLARGVPKTFDDTVGSRRWVLRLFNEEFACVELEVLI